MKKILIALLSALMVIAFGVAITACSKIVGYIDAPTETIEAELGSYTIPTYEVVDADGMVLAGYTVTAKSITDPDGNEVPQAYNSIMVEKPGIYTFVYTTGTKNVADVTVKVDFGDRTAPTITIDESAIPAFFMTGNTYRVPVYTINGGPDSSKCYTKVYHTDENGENMEEVSIEQGTFEAGERSGQYLIWIHVEDAAGNFNDYKYARTVDGPAAVKEDVVMYFDEEFGERQVSPHEELYSGSYVSKEEGAQVHGGETGSFKITLDNVATINNEVYFNIDNPAITDVSGYDYLEMWVYNDNDFNVQVGFRWWNDTIAPAHSWTRVVWSVSEWGNNRDDGEKYVPNTNIIGTQIRIMSFPNNEDGNPYPRGTFYFSSMKGRFGDPNSIAELDYESGASRVEVYEPTAYLGAYSTEKAYGDASGSYKIMMSAKPSHNGEIYLRVTDPVLSDVQSYDYLTLYVYNANEYDAQIGTVWAADQTLVANSWNRVKYPVSMFTDKNVYDVANEVPGAMLRSWDITGFTIRIFGLGDHTQGTFYLSSILGEMELNKQDSVISFNSEEDADNLTVCFANQYKGEYSTEQHHGNEAGSYKVTVDFENGATALRDGHIYLAIAKPQITDIRSYNYLSVYIYNPNEYDAYAGVLWAADTLLKAGEWTELRILNPDHHLAESWVPTEDPNGYETTRTFFADITNLMIRVWGTEENPIQEGDSFYFSGINAITSAKADETKLYAFDETAPASGSDGYISLKSGISDVTIENSADKVYGEESSSTKITYNRVSADISSVVAFGKPLQDACFDCLQFAVYNDTNQDLYVGFEWGGDTLCPKGEWTLVQWKLDAGRIEYSNNSGSFTMPLEGLNFRIVAGDWVTEFEAGSSIYLSAVYGYNVIG